MVVNNELERMWKDVFVGLICLEVLRKTMETPMRIISYPAQIRIRYPPLQ
jgi:hypothetical protein